MEDPSTSPPGRAGHRERPHPRIEEKPQNPPSPYAVIGVYMYDAEVFDIVKTLQAVRPRRAGDHRRQQRLHRPRRDGVRRASSGFWGDAGESIDVYYEIIDFVRANGVNKKPAKQAPAGVA